MSDRAQNSQYGWRALRLPAAAILCAVYAVPLSASANTDVDTILRLCAEPMDSLHETALRFGAAGWRQMGPDDISSLAALSAQAIFARQLTRDPLPADHDLSAFVVAMLDREAWALEQSLTADVNIRARLQIRVAPDNESGFMRLTRDYDNQLSCFFISTGHIPNLDKWGEVSKPLGLNRPLANPEYVSRTRRRLPFDQDDPTLYSADLELISANVPALETDLDYVSDVTFSLFVTSQFIPSPQ